MTHVQTTPATTPDGFVTPKIHASLAEKDLLPREHIVDQAYVDATLLVESEQVYQVNLVDRVATDSSWQANSRNWI